MLHCSAVVVNQSKSAGLLELFISQSLGKGYYMLTVLRKLRSIPLSIYFSLLDTVKLVSASVFLNSLI